MEIHCISYLSPMIFDEFIDLSASSVHSKIVAEVKEAEYVLGALI
jgi:hypothetical protein